MPYATGTATGFVDLYTKLRDFLTSDPALVAAGQNWTVLYGPSSGALSFTTELLLKGPGTAGTDEILVGLHPNVSVPGDYYNLGLSGYPSYNPSDPLSSQVGRSALRYIHLWDSPMAYWFIANGRRFMVVVRVTTVYQSAYAGFILPYHLPTTWAYPLFIGGCSGQASLRYSVANTAGHSAFFNPGGSDITGAEASAGIRLPDGQWTYLMNSYGTGTLVNTNTVIPWADLWMGQFFRDGLDGQPVLLPAEVCVNSPYPANLGALEGVFYIPGFGTASENTVVINGVTYLVVQNVYRTSNGEYAAFALE